MRHRVDRYELFELDINKNSIYRNAENKIDEETVKKYEVEKFKPIEVFKIRNKENIIKELNVRELVQMTKEAKKDEWIYIVTDGCHRATAAINKKINIKAYLIWVDNG